MSKLELQQTPCVIILITIKQYICQQKNTKWHINEAHK